MPAKHTRKTYVADGHYHIYNRGVEKRIVFKNDQDYRVFLAYLKEALSPPPDPKTLATAFTLKGQAFKGIPYQVKNFAKSIQLIAFCLMPNHFHLLLKQKTERAMKEFVQSLLTRYTMYFNKRYKRVGALFQGRYKATYMDTDEYFIHLSRYIHRNPLEISLSLEKAYSSYAAYLGKQRLAWVSPEPVLAFFQKKRTLPFFKQVNTYKSFVERKDADETILPNSLLLDNQ